MSKQDERFLDLCVEGVRTLQPYQAGKPISELKRELGLDDIIKLASNENPLGASPKAIEAVKRLADQVGLYPDGNGFDLKRILSDYHDIGQNHITLGSGSDHLIELISRAFLDSGRSAVMSQYAFAIYFITGKSTGAEMRFADALPPDHDEQPYGHDLDAMLAQVDDTTRVVFIANPNNPTGTFVDGESLRKFLDAVPKDVVVVLDEAYTEYVEDPRYTDGSQLVKDYDNLIVLRTFSKAFGLAGLRVGYALANPVLTDLLNRLRLAFNPNLLAQAAAVAALGDQAHIRKTVELNREGLAQMTAAYTDMGLEYIPSVCNFLTVKVGDAKAINQALLEEGIIVRPLAPYGLTEHLRISIGLPDENRRLISTLRRIVGS
ncbi:MAG: histidinol-phosphate transaminase [Gammaproteobacteria bacterium]|nr:histidinol-phosphate transaminase [Gammaproteobacteria bacterium]